MKKNLCFLTMFFAFMGLMNLINAQNVGVTDKSGGISPANLLQVHKDAATSNTLFQLSNQSTGEAVGDGFQFGIDGSQNGFIINKEPGKNIILGGATDNTTVENDGTVVFNGAATTWEDLRVSINLRTSAGNPPTLTQFGTTGLYVYAFSGSSGTDNIYFEVQLPHSWKEGSTIYPHVHWAPNSNGTGNVKWFLEYSWENIGATFPNSTTTINSVEAAGGEQFVHHMTNIGAGISGTGKNISSILLCHLYRDAGDSQDTYGDWAFLFGFDIHYEINTVGSRTTTSK